MAGFSFFPRTVSLAFLALTAPLASAGTIFNLSFEEPIHHLGSMPTLGAAPDKVSAIVFGTPTVVNDPSPVVNQVLELRAGAVYSQIQLTPPSTVGPTYTLECDVRAKELSGSGYGLSILLDTPEVRTVDFHGPLQWIYTFNPFESTGATHVTFANDTAYHLRVDVDTIANNWKVTVNGNLICNQRFNATLLYSIRLSVSPFYGGTPVSTSPRAYVDNIRLTDVSGNHPPSFSLAAPVMGVTTFEDAPRQTVANLAQSINPGAPDETSQKLTFVASNDNPGLFSEAPAISADGTLTYKPAPNAYGQAVVSVRLQDDGGTAGGGSDISAAQTFKILVNQVNDAPTVGSIADVTVREDTLQRYVGVSGIGTGAANELQTLKVTAASDNPALLPDPAVTYVSPGATASLSLAPISGASGTAKVIVSVTDDGSPAATTVRTFTVTVLPVNDAPIFLRGSDVVLQENAGPQRFPGWATGISRGPADESTQIISFTLSNDNPQLFTATPALSPEGELTFTPAPGARGTATVSVILGDNGGTENGGLDQSQPQFFSIVINPFNLAPTFLKGRDVTAAQKAGAQSLINWATDISPGASYEYAQTLQFVVTADHPELFAVPPDISPGGTLTFTPAPDAAGVALVTVVLMDDGRSDSPNVNASTPRSFKIRVTADDRFTGTYAALLQPAEGAPWENGRAGLLSLTVNAGGNFTGKLALQGQTLPIQGRFDDAGTAQFTRSAARLTVRRARQSVLELELQATIGDGQYKLNGTLLKEGEPYATLAGDRALFVAGPATPPFQNLPDGLAGSYTVLLQPRAPEKVSLAAAPYPTAPGVGVLTVSSSGIARLVGNLPDGTGLAYANFLSLDRQWPLYLPLARGAGSVSGRVTFQDQPGISDLDGPLRWFLPADRRRPVYPDGWPSGLLLQLLGSNYEATTAAAALNRYVVDWDGNTQLTLIGGGLSSPIQRPVNFSPSFALIIMRPGPERLTLACDKATGLIQGTLALDRRPAIPLRAVVFPKQSAAFGFFLGGGTTGGISLVPAARPVSSP